MGCQVDLTRRTYKQLWKWRNCFSGNCDLKIGEQLPKWFSNGNLKAQLKILPDLIVRHKELTGNTIKRVTNIQTLCDVMNGNPVAKHMFPDLHSLLKLYLTILVTTATAERIFSTMRRLKTYLRSSMSHERLNHTFILQSHKSRVDSLDLSQIAQALLSVNERRCMYCWKCKVCDCVLSFY